jgi:hypothetical protein
MTQRDCNGITQRDNTSPVAVASGRERPCKGLLLPIRTDAENTVKEIATGYTARQALERAALAAHADGMTWAEWFPTVAAEVSQAEPDYYTRGKLIHKLVGLVVSGDTDGQRPIDGGYGRPLDFELEAIEAAR